MLNKVTTLLETTAFNLLEELAQFHRIQKETSELIPGANPVTDTEIRLALIAVERGEQIAELQNEIAALQTELLQAKLDLLTAANRLP